MTELVRSEDVRPFEEQPDSMFGPAGSTGATPAGAIHHLDNLSNDPLVADAFADPLTHDGALVRASAAGSRQAFALLVRRYEAAVYGWAAHALGSTESAAALTRELFRRAWLRAASAPLDIGQWLMQIAFELASEMGAPGAGQQRDLDALWLGGIVKEALEHLPAYERQLLIAPQRDPSSSDRVTTGIALDRLRALLAARSIERRGQ